MATTETKTFKNFIGGEWVDAASGETFESRSPATGETIGLFPKSGPEDADRAVGDRLVKHPDVRVITLTGSRETGVEVMRNAADGLKHVHLELGGKNAIIVLDDADLDLAVEGIVWSAFGTSGQRCTAASRVIVQEGAYEALSSRLVSAAESLRLGVGWEDDTDVGPVINEG